MLMWHHVNEERDYKSRIRPVSMAESQWQSFMDINYADVASFKI
jgi:hypothetical protein